ncbi:MAG: OmpA family protein [Deltaproteobacteria bacterium]|nr:OmpA family protein [Deltaproteobacteria bacterium]
MITVAAARRQVLPLAIALTVLSAAFGGCAGQKTRGKASGVADIIKAARKNGAYRCAPKELALAEAHLARTNDELDLGNFVPGGRHLALADKNARLAFDNSPPEKCAAKADSDGDGCMDNVDRCPNEPEDKDGFQDDDCCPDPDNDQDGIPDVDDLCPNVPEDRDNFQDADGCPEPDNDRDGIPDRVDSCPNQPEDLDGFEDTDGCPDLDNDKDRIPDLKDKCPNQPEDYDGDQDTDGCPDKYKLVTVTPTKIELKQKIFFATARTRILSRSFQLLNEVAQALKDNATLHVRIEGHTDSRGADRYNQRLSEGRANSVRLYLIRRGIDAARLGAVGFGESKPIASNRTRAGRAMNRRVEFVITKK